MGYPIKLCRQIGIKEHGHIKQSVYDTLRATMKKIRLKKWLYIKARPHLGPVYIDNSVPSNVEAVYGQQKPIE
ncbi:MAG: hypothetical protein EZS28_022673 [Streblomastix strix]|uniref:Uncharacterized protein n=1 Tax=Streblomastix strix TaxID=222440 RepID=A0A5J4VGT7_9EUKA|nr:MAG: hypothetical protein EZS28_022673 [Streblomastix strix]